jgi:hypothetical protein
VHGEVRQQIAIADTATPYPFDVTKALGDDPPASLACIRALDVDVEAPRLLGAPLRVWMRDSLARWTTVWLRGDSPAMMGESAPMEYQRRTVPWMARHRRRSGKWGGRPTVRWQNAPLVCVYQTKRPGIPYRPLVRRIAWFLPDFGCWLRANSPITSLFLLYSRAQQVPSGRGRMTLFGANLPFLCGRFLLVWPRPPPISANVYATSFE